MIRTLSLIAISGFLLAVVCLSVAIGMAGPEVIERGAWGWTGHGWDYHWTHDHDVTFNVGSGPQDSRTLAWSGETLEVDVPGDVHFTQGPGAPSLLVKGPKDALDHLVVENGRIRYDRPMFDGPDLTIELTAPKVTRFTLNGSGNLDLNDYAQDALALNINGDGDVTARGQTKAVDVVISGSGNADLSGLQADGADVRISGSGDAKVAPKSWSKVDISGSGDVTLTTHPARQESHVSGSGRIEQQDGSSSTGSDDDGGDQT